LSHIRLIPFSVEYAADMAELLAERAVHQYLDLPLCTTDNCKSFITNAMAMEALGFARHRLILNSNDTLIGGISLVNIDQDEGSAFMGTWLGRAYWGQGYNQAAKMEMLRIAFEQLCLKRVFFVTPREHTRSLRALEKLPCIQVHVNRDYPSLCKRIEYQLGREIVLSVVTKEQWETK
jgi:RimJ/RimL family protein N-acetyltransferase